MLFLLDDEDSNDNNNIDDDGILHAWERVTTQWRVVGGSSLHNTVEVFTNKKHVNVRYIQYYVT